MIRISVPDMSCGHCKASITTALAPLTSRLEFDMSSRELLAEGGRAEELLAALDQIGFPASVIG